MDHGAAIGATPLGDGRTLVRVWAPRARRVEMVIGAGPGRSVALEILYEGRIFDAREAREKGLVNRVVPDERVAQECRETAQRIADGAPLVARWHKKFARRLAGGETPGDAECLEAFDCFDTEDFRIGYRAFLAKEKPAFVGR